MNDKEQCVQTDVMQSVLKASDLRIGNKLLFLGDVVTFKNITEIREDGIFWIKTFEPKIESKNFHFKPIPLTEEWLLKFGFKKDIIVDLYRLHNQFGSIIYYPSTSVEKAKINFMLTEACFMNNTIINVHQLQNLYFDLTGDELTVA